MALWMRNIIVVLITLASGTVGVAQNRSRNTVVPVDEATTDKELLAVRTAAKDALRAKDYDGFMVHVSADLQMQGDPEITRVGVRSVLPSMAQKILAALSSGGCFTTTRGSVKGERQFCGPYLYSAFPTRFTELQ
jgi:hypothetical protein